MTQIRTEQRLSHRVSYLMTSYVLIRVIGVYLRLICFAV